MLRKEFFFFFFLERMNIINPKKSHVLNTLIHVLFLALCCEIKKLYIESTIIINLTRSQAFEINMHSRLEFFFFIVALINGIQRTELTHTVYHHEVW